MASTRARTTGGDAPRQRLVVLPLTNISPEAADAYFADGLTEELISTLSRIPGLGVIARTTAMRYRAGERSIAQIREELRVSTLVEGSVRKDGARLRISIQVVDAATEEHIAALDYDRELADVFAIQRDVAARVARALRLRLGRRPRSGGPTPARAAAFAAYLRGRLEWNRRTESGLRAAIGLFEEALRADPSFAPAEVGLSDAHAQLGWLEFVRPSEAFPAARAAAERALELDPTLGTAHTALGFVRFLYDRDWEGAARELRRGVELDPGSPTAHQFLADYLKAMGRFDEALREMRLALDLDPMSMAINTALGHVLYLRRDFDAAIEQYRRALALDPSFALARLWFGRPFLETGRFDDALREVREAVRLTGDGTMALAVLGHVEASAGHAAPARRILDRLLDRGRSQYVPPYWIALLYAGLDDPEHALEWLERAFEERSSWLVWIGVEPRFDRVRRDPRFQRLLERLALGTGPPGPSKGARERRLVAIMFTDLVGFTRLAGEDERKALALLEEHRSLVREATRAHAGREVKTIGDGFLIEFDSAVESVACALEIQQALARRNSGQPAGDRVALRIGIHVGDVVRDGADLVGDGVNIASRVQSLAEAGGICVTGAVWEQVRRKVPVVGTPVGNPRLKNVIEPVAVLRLAARTGRARSAPRPARRRRTASATRAARRAVLRKPAR